MELIVRKTTHQIIDETVEYYKNNPRSKDGDGNCVYNGPNGEKCAFSRLAKPDFDFKYFEGENCAAILNKAFQEDILLPEYCGHPNGFYADLQALHDRDYYWSNNNLTKEGIEFVENMKKDYPE